MKQIVFVVALALLPFAVRAQAPVSVAASASAPTVPVVGTFDKTSIVLAFYGSPQWAAILADRKYELSVAKNANDSAKVKELEKWGGDRQELAMQQAMGKAPIANILEVLQPELKAISGKMKLASIVESPSPDPKAPTVDVTSLLMDWLRASQETRKEASDMHQQHPAAK